MHVDLTIQVLFARVRWWRLESEKGSLHRLCGGRLLAEAETQMAAWAQAARDSPSVASDEAVRVPHLCCWNYRALFCVVSMGCAVVVYVVYTSYAHARPQNLAEQRRYV